MPPKFPHHFRGTVLWRLTLVTCSVTATGLSPCIVRHSRRVCVSERSIGMSPKHHISDTFQCQIRFALLGFQSPLLTQSQLISSPAGTKTFQFPAFPTLSGSKRKSYSEISGSNLAYRSPEHFAVSRVLRRRLEPSLPPARVLCRTRYDLIIFARPHKHVVGVVVWSSTIKWTPTAFALQPRGSDS